MLQRTLHHAARRGEDQVFGGQPADDAGTRHTPWAKGCCESFNSKLRDELLAGEQFSTLYEA